MRLRHSLGAAVAAFALLSPLAASAFTQSVTASAAGATAPLPIDLAKSRCGLALILTISGTLTASVQVTGDKITNDLTLPQYTIAANYNPATTNWNNLETMTGLTVSADSNLMFPVVAARLNVTAYTSGKATLSIVENDTCPR